MGTASYASYAFAHLKRIFKQIPSQFNQKLNCLSACLWMYVGVSVFLPFHFSICGCAIVCVCVYVFKTYIALITFVWGLWSDVHLFSLSWQRRASRLQEMRKSAFCFHLTHNANIRLNRLLTSKALLSLLVAYTRLYTLFCLSVCPTIILFLHVCIDTRFTHQPCRRCTLGCRRSKYTMGRNERKCTIS